MEVIIPYPQEHSLRLLSPETEHIRVRRTKGGMDVRGVKVPGSCSVIWYIQERDGEEVAIPQAIRFPTQYWTEEEARKWIKDNEMEGTFEPASKEAEDKIYMSNETKILDLAIYNAIGGYSGVSSESIKKKLADKTINTVMLDINSPGGSVFEGMAIYNALKAHPANVHVKISGVSASIASVIAMAGDTIEMTKNSMMMIHLPTVSTNGNATELRKEADLLDRMQQNIVDVFKSKLKKPCDLDSMLTQETWLTPEEAKEYGFCDIITDTTPENLNYFDFSQYRYKAVPELVLNLYDINANHEIPKIKDEFVTEEFIDRIINKLKDIFQLKKENKMSDKIKNQETPPEKKEEEEVTAQETPETTEELLKKIEALVAENAALKAKIEEMEKGQAEEEEKKVEEDYKDYLNTLVDEGKIRPADIDIHVESLISRHKDEDKVKSYKDMLESLPVSIEIGSHFADKETAPEKVDNKAVEKEAQKLYREYKSKGEKKTLGDCLKEAHFNLMNG